MLREIMLDGRAFHSLVVVGRKLFLEFILVSLIILVSCMTFCLTVEHSIL